MTATWCTDVELAGKLPAVLSPDAPAAFSSARVLVRLHGAPLGFVETALPPAGLTTGTLLAAVDARLLAEANEHLAGDGQAPVASVASVADLPAADGDPACRPRPDESVTVVVCTRDRPAVLEGCLRRLRLTTYAPLEVIIVDNAPPDDATRDAFDRIVGDDPRFRYVREPRPGLSCARNRGLREATGSVLAFTDDDVSVDADWVRALAAGFRSPDVACVTGLVCTASIDGPAERYFDARVSWGDRCQPARHHLGGPTDDGLFPYSPGIFGTGASFAVRPGVMRALGGFDEALGAGTRTGGGEDLDAFVRIVLAGHTLAYEPSALVWHHHRADLDGLRRQMLAYGVGLSAFLTKHLLDPGTRGHVLRRVPRGVRRMAAIAGGTHDGLTGPEAAATAAAGAPGSGAAGAAATAGAEAAVPATALLLRELGGFALGPVRYVQARRSVPEPVR